MGTEAVAELVTTAEAMPILKVTQPSSVIRLVKSGKLTPVHKLPGRTGAYVFARADIELLAAQRGVK
jgi:hypothetical protein